jgi:hypothetical protein
MVRNDEETYLQTGGLWDLDLHGLDPRLRARLSSDDCELVLEQTPASPAGNVLLSESEYMVASDCEASYVDEPPPGADWETPAATGPLTANPDAPWSGRVPIYVWRKGRPAEGETTLGVELWQVGLIRPGENSPPAPRQLTGETVVAPSSQFEFSLRPPTAPGIYTYRFVPPGWWPQTLTGQLFPIAAADDCRTIVRVLPFDDYQQLADDEVTFAFIYAEVLRYYNLIYPAMSQEISLSDPSLWSLPASVQYLNRVLDPGLWSTPLAMPRSRDLPGARRKLLQRYCRLVLERSAGNGRGAAPADSGTGVAPHGVAVAAAAAPAGEVSPAADAPATPLQADSLAGTETRLPDPAEAVRLRLEER